MLTKEDLENIQTLVHQEVDPLKTDIRIVKRNLSKLKKTVDIVIEHFDGDLVKLQKRVKKVENHLNLND